VLVEVVDVVAVPEDVVPFPAVEGGVGAVVVDRAGAGSGDAPDVAAQAFDAAGFVREPYVGNHDVSGGEVVEDQVGPAVGSVEVASAFDAEHLEEAAYLGELPFRLVPAERVDEPGESFVVHARAGHQRVQPVQGVAHRVGERPAGKPELGHQQVRDRILPRPAIARQPDQHPVHTTPTNKFFRRPHTVRLGLP
jgi:hypothetical protein